MKHFHRFFYPPAWPIAAKISAALVAAALIPMSFITYYNLRQSLDSVEAGEYRKLELLATSVASRLDQLIIDIQRIVVQVSSDRNVVNFLAANSSGKRVGLRNDMQQTLQNVFRSNPDFDAIFVMDKNGRAVAATDPTFVGQNYAFREYFRSSIKGNSYISSILVGETTKRPGMFFSHPVRSPSGEIVGVLVLKIRGADIWAIVNALQVGYQSYAFLIDQQGVIISHADKSLLYHSLISLPLDTLKQIVADRRYGLEQIQSLNIPELKVMVKAKQIGHTTYRYSPHQMPRIVGFAPLEQQPWVLGISKPKAQFAAPLNHLIWLHASSVLVVGGITGMIALFLGRKISRPIHALTSAAQALELEHDDFDSYVLELHQSLAKSTHSQDDIGQLVRVFLKMSEEVRMRNQKLKMQVQELRIEIDETKRASNVAEITENDHFQQLQIKIQKLREQTVTVSETETEYYQRLQSKVQSLKERSLTSEV
ncbi:PDC sensor domain-containing protein [aff. Roholtiella sp. LEGE 12411]|uniref:PDC sensor domain-containing protein n=1 Tax=aff. Roholtiella sp. LEGE 12411 TaxID=1828822 RepID=UPI00187F1D76|nr:cache domain-containing protein [aff. Roholtiella sp. LEGE 12411]MBE9035822.1 HAMP domain-containing protein [aff. Roholtiella sp. LEGE 12411]